MAQRKSAPPGRPGSGKAGGTAGTRAGGREAPAGRTPTKSTASSAARADGSTAARSGATRQPGRPPTRRPGKSIVNQKQTPWGLIAATVAIVLFAAAIVVVVIATHKSGSNKNTTATKGGQSVDANDPYRQPELPAAKAINGVTYRVEGQHNHVEGNVSYESTPPVGGNHSQYWADCTGTVYANPIANENAVHMLEHGAIWITYNAKTLPASGLAQLQKYVSGQDRMALSPYPNLRTPISLQAWGYQLSLSSASDPRIAQFISTLRYNQKTTPEYGATCSQPTFKKHPSTFGHPLWTPASGAAGNTMGA